MRRLGVSRGKIPLAWNTANLKTRDRGIDTLQDRVRIDIDSYNYRDYTDSICDPCNTVERDKSRSAVNITSTGILESTTIVLSDKYYSGSNQANEDR